MFLVRGRSVFRESCPQQGPEDESDPSREQGTEPGEVTEPQKHESTGRAGQGPELKVRGRGEASARPQGPSSAGHEQHPASEDEGDMTQPLFESNSIHHKSLSRRPQVQAHGQCAVPCGGR